MQSDQSQITVADDTFKKDDHFQIGPIKSFNVKREINDIEDYSSLVNSGQDGDQIGKQGLLLDTVKTEPGLVNGIDEYEGRQCMPEIKRENENFYLNDVAIMPAASSENSENSTMVSSNTDVEGVHMYIFNADDNVEINQSEKTPEDGSKNRRKRKGTKPKKISKVVENPVEEKTYTCTICDERFDNQRDLRTHVRIHAPKPQPENIYICSVCGEEFTSKKKYRLHGRTHDQHICSYCGEKFNMKSKLRKHLITHTGYKIHKCEICGKVCKRKTELNAHMRIHTGEKPYLCSTCGKGFKFPHHLKGHLLIHTGEKPFKCETCGRGFNDKSSMRRHSKTHLEYEDSVTEGFFSVDESGQLIVTDSESRRPVRRRPIYVRSHVCEFCGKAFIKGQHLRVHIRIHTGEKPHQCEECGKQFNDPSSLRRHRKTYAGRPHGSTDEKTKEYKCHVCNKEFCHGKNYRNHIRRHTEGKTFDCSTCGKIFHTKNQLRRHTTKHMLDKPYKCTVCDKRFSTYSIWYCHFKSHKGDKKFQCNICDKYLSTGAHLKSHLQTHTGSLPYSCDICDKVFVHGTSWKNHMKTHNKNSDESTADVESTVAKEVEAAIQNAVASHDRKLVGEITPQPTFNEEKSVNQTHNLTAINPPKENYMPPIENQPNNDFMSLNDSGSNLHKQNNKLTDDLANFNSFEEFTSTLSDNFREYIQTYLKGGEQAADSNTGSYSGFSNFNLGNNVQTYSPHSSITKSPVKAFPCTQCDKSFTEKRTLRLHFRLHTGLNVHECNICGKIFPKRYNYDRHMRIHFPKQEEKPKPFPCTECNKSFRDKGSLSTHLRIHTGINLNECDICGKIFTKRYNFERHVAMHVRRDEKISSMKNGFLNSGNNFNTTPVRKNLEGHIPGISEPDSKQYACTECGKRFSDKSTLNTHFRIHTGVGLQECHICGKKFTKRYNLKQHMLTHPVDSPNSDPVQRVSKPYPCDRCEKSFSEKGTLQTHYRIHTGENLRICDFCGKKFTKSYNYLRHIRIHTGDRPFKCDYCEKGFSDNSSLTRHLMKKHPEMAPLHCDICNLGFFNDASIEKHKLSHDSTHDQTLDTTIDEIDLTDDQVRSHETTNDLTDEDTQDYIADFSKDDGTPSASQGSESNDPLHKSNSVMQTNVAQGKNLNSSKIVLKKTENDEYMVQVKIEPTEYDQEYIF